MFGFLFSCLIVLHFPSTLYEEPKAVDTNSRVRPITYNERHGLASLLHNDLLWTLISYLNEELKIEQNLSFALLIRFSENHEDVTCYTLVLYHIMLVYLF